MALFKNPFKPQPPAPKPVSYPPVPDQLPKISAPNASQIAKTSQPSPGAQKLLTTQQTPSQYLNALQDKQMGDDMVKTLAHGMSDREGVDWASKSAEKVSDKLPPEDVNAMKAAQNWAKNPTPENKTAAAAAAAKTNYQGPGAWAAQGAAWSQPAASSGAAGAAATPRMTPHAVTGSVLLSAAIKANPALAAPIAKAPAVKAPTAPTQPATPKTPSAPATPQLAAPQAPAPVVPPAIQAQTFQQQHPFIAMGIDIASGKGV